jgi:hypothetical protein
MKFRLPIVILLTFSLVLIGSVRLIKGVIIIVGKNECELAMVKPFDSSEITLWGVLALWFVERDGHDTASASA